jgi:hypothetical protein
MMTITWVFGDDLTMVHDYLHAEGTPGLQLMYSLRARKPG